MKRINKDVVYTFKESIKKSSFITIIKYIENEKMLKEFLNNYKDLKASHNVYVSIYREDNKIVEIVKEDGEPKNTSGYPIYNVLKSNKIENIVVLVIRYFGGTLLGKGTLSRAYSSGLLNLLKNEIEIKEHILSNMVYIQSDKANINFTISQINKLSPIDLKYKFEGNNCIISFYSDLDEKIIRQISNIRFIKIMKQFR